MIQARKAEVIPRCAHFFVIPGMLRGVADQGISPRVRASRHPAVVNKQPGITLIDTEFLNPEGVGTFRKTNDR